MKRRTLLFIGFIIGLIWSRTRSTRRQLFMVVLESFLSTCEERIRRSTSTTEKDQAEPSKVRYGDPLSRRPPSPTSRNVFGQ